MTAHATLYPAFLLLKDRKVVVIGGGTVAERKVRALLASGARVHVVAPRLTAALGQWAGQEHIAWHPVELRHGDDDVRGAFPWLDGAWLVIAATDDRAVNARVSELATGRQLWVNVVDDPELSSFQVPAVVDRTPIAIAISSGGSAPVLARRLRERIETLVDHDVGELARMLAARRDAIRQAHPDLAQRRRFYDWTLDGPVMPLIRQGRTEQAAAALDGALLTPHTWPRQALALLPAPATDPGMLTLKALRALHEADAIVFDPRMHMDSILDMARRDAERLPVDLDSWSSHTQAVRALSTLLQRHGRVVLLLSETARNAICEGVSVENIAPALESIGVVVERF